MPATEEEAVVEKCTPNQTGKSLDVLHEQKPPVNAKACSATTQVGINGFLDAHEVAVAFKVVDAFE